MIGRGVFIRRCRLRRDRVDLAKCPEMSQVLSCLGTILVMNFPCWKNEGFFLFGSMRPNRIYYSSLPVQ